MFNQTAKQLFGYEQVAKADCEYPLDKAIKENKVGRSEDGSLLPILY